MHRIIVLYEQEPDADAYAAHAELCHEVANSVFRHGPVTGSPMGEKQHAYYAEWEFADKDAMEAFAGSEQLGSIGKDAHTRGLPRPFAEFLEVS